MGHVDLGIQKEFGGPGRSVGRFGVTVLNLAFTPVAPATATFSEGGPYRVVYRRRIFLPPVPTFTLNLEF
jgi:hypothetical protein